MDQNKKNCFRFLNFFEWDLFNSVLRSRKHEAEVKKANNKDLRAICRNSSVDPAQPDHNAL